MAIIANNTMKMCTHYSENPDVDIIIIEENLVAIGLIIVEILIFLKLTLILFQG